MRDTRRLVALLALAMFGALPLSAAAAQAVHPFAVGLSAGPAFLGGDDRDVLRDGVAAQGTLAVGFPVLPIQLRADLGYQSFQGKDFTVATPGGQFTASRDLTVWSGTLSVVARPGASMGIGIVRPYLSAGGGYYRTSFDELNSEPDAKDDGLGFTGALGVTVPVAGLNAFFEFRLHHFDRGGQSMQTYPLVAGFIF